MDKIKAIEKEIEKIISKSPHRTDPEHSKSTKKWILKLKPNADEAMQIAALAHDIERGFIGEKEAKLKEKNKNYDKHKEEHAKRSVKVISALLRKYDFHKEFIKKVEHLVLYHEVGGDEDTDFLKDADSISFFEDNLEYYFEVFGNEKTKFKIKYMFDRISEKAKGIINKYKYDNFKLNKLFKDVILDLNN